MAESKWPRHHTPAFAEGARTSEIPVAMSMAGQAASAEGSLRKLALPSRVGLPRSPNVVPALAAVGADLPLRACGRRLAVALVARTLLLGLVGESRPLALVRALAYFAGSTLGFGGLAASLTWAVFACTEWTSAAKALRTVATAAIDPVGHTWAVAASLANAGSKGTEAATAAATAAVRWNSRCLDIGVVWSRYHHNVVYVLVSAVVLR